MRNLKLDLLGLLPPCGDVRFFPIPGKDEGSIQCFPALSFFRTHLQATEEEILDALDSAARDGEIKIFRIETAEGMLRGDVGFAIEFGIGKRRHASLGTIADETEIVRDYRAEPLSAGERGPEAILKVKETAIQVVDEALNPRKHAEAVKEIRKELKKSEKSEREALVEKFKRQLRGESR